MIIECAQNGLDASPFVIFGDIEAETDKAICVKQNWYPKSQCKKRTHGWILPRKSTTLLADLYIKVVNELSDRIRTIAREKAQEKLNALNALLARCKCVDAADQVVYAISATIFKINFHLNAYTTLDELNISCFR